MRNGESSFTQLDDTVDQLADPFLFLLHKQHHGNDENHKKRKRSGAAPRP